MRNLLLLAMVLLAIQCKKDTTDYRSKVSGTYVGTMMYKWTVHGWEFSQPSICTDTVTVALSDTSRKGIIFHDDSRTNCNNTDPNWTPIEVILDDQYHFSTPTTKGSFNNEDIIIHDTAYLFSGVYYREFQGKKVK